MSAAIEYGAALFVFMFGTVGAYVAFFLLLFGIYLGIKGLMFSPLVKAVVVFLAASVALTYWYPKKTGFLASKLFVLIQESIGNIGIGLIAGLLMGYLVCEFVYSYNISGRHGGRRGNSINVNYEQRRGGQYN